MLCDNIKNAGSLLLKLSALYSPNVFDIINSWGGVEAADLIQVNTIYFGGNNDLLHLPNTNKSYCQFSIPFNHCTHTHTFRTFSLMLISKGQELIELHPFLIEGTR